MGFTQPSFPSVQGIISSGLKRPRRELTTHLYPVPRLRMSGTTSPVPLYAFVAGARITLP